MEAQTKNMPGGKMVEPPKGKRGPGDMPGGAMSGQAVSKAEPVKPVRKTASARKPGAKKQRGASKSAGAVSTAARPAANKRGGAK